MTAPANELQYRPHPAGGSARAPARTPTGGRAPLPPTPTCTEHRRSRKKTWETSSTYRNYTKEIPIQDNSRITKCTEITSGFGSPHTDDREAICLVPDLFLRHSLLAMISHYTVLKQMFSLDLTQYRQTSSQTTDIWSSSSRCVHSTTQTSKTERDRWKSIYDTPTVRKTLPLRSHC